MAGLWTLIDGAERKDLADIAKRFRSMEENLPNTATLFDIIYFAWGRNS
jgi:hypothetical protein